jgi:hypothetical protein
MLRAIPLMLIALAAPVVAQEPGLGVVGDGAQTQSVELLDGSVSVTLESSGSVSLGRGDPSVGAGLDLSVNDVTIVGVGGDRSRAGDGGDQPGGKGVVAAGPAGRANAEVETAIVTDGASSAECGVRPSEPALAEALNSGREIWLRPSSCASADGALVELAALYAAIKHAFSIADRPLANLADITISDDFVILGVVD